MTRLRTHALREFGFDSSYSSAAEPGVKAKLLLTLHEAHDVCLDLIGHQ